LVISTESMILILVASVIPFDLYYFWYAELFCAVHDFRQMRWVAHGSQDSEHLSPPACPASAVCTSCVFICFLINCKFTVGDVQCTPRVVCQLCHFEYFLGCYVQYPRSVLSRSSTRLTRDNPPPPHIFLVSDISQLKVLAAASYSAQSHVLRVCFSSGVDGSEMTILRGNMAKCRYLLKNHSNTFNP